jgi:hypothetical protein
MNRTHLCPWLMSYNIFEFGFEFAEKFKFEVWLAAVNIAASHHCPLVSQNSPLNMYVAESHEEKNAEKSLPNNIAVSCQCPLHNLAVSQNSPLNMLRSVKSRRQLI